MRNRQKLFAAWSFRLRGISDTHQRLYKQVTSAGRRGRLPTKTACDAPSSGGGVLKPRYRYSAESERKALRVGELERRWVGNARACEIPGYMSLAHDCAVAIADDDYAEVARLDPSRASALRKMAGAKQGA